MTTVEHKLVCVGDGGCGKTSLLSVYTTGAFPTNYTPTVFETHVKEIPLARPWVRGARTASTYDDEYDDDYDDEYDEQRHDRHDRRRSGARRRRRQDDGDMLRLSLWDTAGQEDYDRLRPLTYPGSSVILLCYAVDMPASLLNAAERWFPEIRHFLPHTPILVVGLKSDLRTNDRLLGLLASQGLAPVSAEQGRRAAMEMGADGWVECSSRLGVAVGDVFQDAIDLCLNRSRRPLPKASTASHAARTAESSAAESRPPTVPTKDDLPPPLSPRLARTGRPRDNSPRPVTMDDDGDGDMWGTSLAKPTNNDTRSKRKSKRKSKRCSIF